MKDGSMAFYTVGPGYVKDKIGRMGYNPDDEMIDQIFSDVAENREIPGLVESMIEAYLERRIREFVGESVVACRCMCHTVCDCNCTEIKVEAAQTTPPTGYPY